MPTVLKCARAGAVKVGAEHLHDDVGQELALLLVNKLAAKYDPTYNIEPLLIESARRISLGMLASNRELTRDDIEDPYSCNNNESVWGDSFTPDLAPVEAPDQHKAEQIIRNRQETIMGCMPGIVIDTKPAKPAANSDKSVAGTNAKLSPAKRATKERKLTTEQAHMREMRVKLDLSQAAWAHELNISTATIAAYEYGRTQSVSKKVYEAAKDCFARGRHILKTRERFDKMKMSEIVDDWGARLRVDPNDMRSMAELMDKEVSTILRWRYNTQRPDIKALKGYDDKVNRLVPKLAKIAEDRVKEEQTLAKEAETIKSLTKSMVVKKKAGTLQPA